MKVTPVLFARQCMLLADGMSSALIHLNFCCMFGTLGERAPMQRLRQLDFVNYLQKTYVWNPDSLSACYQ